ncbi:hypothetical protein [Candidatus Nucleicultrix amoebiphila]|uniref:Uncharacterized protein n=1 Tax=Candidatus Nucleicultrix amoebiphila FS5 TaxID=1414854 RepID=A0A1W6N5A4_9PROT|nr:hypothetical protein [Candidatus Nucleicultrix amoebiphila]ARN84958.1 hypothetical protein GQ61_06295 [Candidatus Nucleicultrix amoebiphila FS5]
MNSFKRLSISCFILIALNTHVKASFQEYLDDSLQQTKTIGRPRTPAGVLLKTKQAIQMWKDIALKNEEELRLLKGKMGNEVFEFLKNVIADIIRELSTLPYEDHALQNLITQNYVPVGENFNELSEREKKTTTVIASARMESVKPLYLHQLANTKCLQHLWAIKEAHQKLLHSGDASPGLTSVEEDYRLLASTSQLYNRHITWFWAIERLLVVLTLEGKENADAVVHSKKTSGEELTLEQEKEIEKPFLRPFQELWTTWCTNNEESPDPQGTQLIKIVLPTLWQHLEIFMLKMVGQGWTLERMGEVAPGFIPSIEKIKAFHPSLQAQQKSTLRFSELLQVYSENAREESKGIYDFYDADATLEAARRFQSMWLNNRLVSVEAQLNFETTTPQFLEPWKKVMEDFDPTLDQSAYPNIFKLSAWYEEERKADTLTPTLVSEVKGEFALGFFDYFTEETRKIKDHPDYESSEVNIAGKILFKVLHNFQLIGDSYVHLKRLEQQNDDVETLLKKAYEQVVQAKRLFKKSLLFFRLKLLSESELS